MHFSSQLIKEREQTQATCAHFENGLDEATCKKIIEKTNQINNFFNFDIVGITEPIQFTS